jgi:hypothetical protein
MDMHYGHLYICSMDKDIGIDLIMDMLYGHGQAEWTRAYRMEMVKQHEHGQGHATWTSTCTIEQDMQHRHMDAPSWTCARSTGMDMKIGMDM